MSNEPDRSEGLRPEVFLDTILTTILIGEDKTPYHVHKALLCQKVGYFAAAYRCNMKEATENKFVIKKVSQPAFRSLITWLYTGKVFLDPGIEPALSYESDPHPESDLRPESDLHPKAELLPESEFQPEEGARDYISQDLTIEAEYDAISETNPDRNYEYSEGSEDENIWPAGNVSPPPSPRSRSGSPSRTGVVERTPSQQLGEQIVRRLFSETDPDDLDSYQMETLSHIFGNDDKAAPSIAKWKSILEAKKAETRQYYQVNDQVKDQDMQQASTFDRLLDVYIIADRFDVSLLRKDTLELLDAEKDGTRTILTEQTLPSYAFVVKAYENLPTGSELLSWLINVFAHRWTPAGDTPEECEARSDLPREFLFDLASALVERRAVSE